MSIQPAFLWTTIDRVPYLVTGCCYSCEKDVEKVRQYRNQHVLMKGSLRHGQ